MANESGRCEIIHGPAGHVKNLRGHGLYGEQIGEKEWE